MFARAKPAALGEVEGFISHSWSDPGAEKYQQLQNWLSEVQRSKATQAPVRRWLDKACIDQSDITANLAALPVFLSGCNDLVVLAGKTYASRLWCVIELFTFLRMGGERDKIRVYELHGSDDDDVRTALATFDAAKARCFLDKDRERLLGVVEAGFGDFTPFNKIVRGVFTRDHSAKDIEVVLREEE